MAEQISVVIITRNEEANISRCLNSVRWADEIVMADSGSTDRTVEIGRQFGCRMYHQEWLGFGPMKRYAVNLASHDWILSLDADEEVSGALRDRIQEMLAASPDHHGYRVRRRTEYLGRLIRFCGWNHDYPLRLFNRRYGTFNERPVHESVQMDGSIGIIEETITHYSYPTLHCHVEKMNRYTELGAELMRQEKRRSSVALAVLCFIGKFMKVYVLKLGFLDGKAGFVLACNSAFGVYLKYLKVWEQTS